MAKHISDQTSYLGVSLNTLLKNDDDIQRQVKSLYCVANKLEGTSAQFSSAAKNSQYSMSTACQCMLANCGANSHKLV